MTRLARGAKCSPATPLVAPSSPAACIVPAKPIDPKPIAVRRSISRRETRGTKGVFISVSFQLQLNQRTAAHSPPTARGHIPSNGRNCHLPETAVPASFLHRSPAGHKASDRHNRLGCIWRPTPNRVLPTVVSQPTPQLLP